MYSVLLYKATRGYRSVENGLPYDKACKLGMTVYEGWKRMNSSFPELTVSGVCVRIVRTEDAEQVMADRLGLDKRVLEQYGSA